MQLDIALPSTSVKPTDDGLCQHNPSASDDEVVRRGQEAWARQRRAFEDWMAIAEALQIGRGDVMRDVHTNQPTGKWYEKAMAAWLVANGFKEIDKGARNRLLECLKHRIEIEKWRARLTDTERFRFNHPDTVLRKWKAATVIADPNAAPKPLSPQAKMKEVNIDLQERLHRAERELASRDGDLWKPTDTAVDIAGVMIAVLSPAKAERTAKEIIKKLKERKAST
jgi:hypothetical protein